MGHVLSWLAASSHSAKVSSDGQSFFVSVPSEYTQCDAHEDSDSVQKQRTEEAVRTWCVGKHTEYL